MTLLDAVTGFDHSVNADGARQMMAILARAAPPSGRAMARDISAMSWIGSTAWVETASCAS
eukprot:11491365-Alexandrium_andersonii.AAC.1